MFKFKEELIKIARVISGEPEGTDSNFSISFNKYSRNTDADSLLSALDELARKTAFIESTINAQSKGKESDTEKAMQYEASGKEIQKHCTEVVKDAFENRLMKCKSLEEIREIGKAIGKLHKRGDAFDSYVGHRKLEELFSDCREMMDRVSMQMFGQRLNMGLWGKAFSHLRGKSAMAVGVIGEALGDIDDISEAVVRQAMEARQKVRGVWGGGHKPLGFDEMRYNMTK